MKAQVAQQQEEVWLQAEAWIEAEAEAEEEEWKSSIHILETPRER